MNDSGSLRRSCQALADYVGGDHPLTQRDLEGCSLATLDLAERLEAHSERVAALAESWRTK